MYQNIHIMMGKQWEKRGTFLLWPLGFARYTVPMCLVVS